MGAFSTGPSPILHPDPLDAQERGHQLRPARGCRNQYGIETSGRGLWPLPPQPAHDKVRGLDRRIDILQDALI